MVSSMSTQGRSTCWICESEQKAELFPCAKCGLPYHERTCGSVVPRNVEYHPIDPDDLLRGQVSGYRDEHPDLTAAVCDVCRGRLPKGKNERLRRLTERRQREDAWQEMVRQAEIQATRSAAATREVQEKAQPRALRERIQQLEDNRLQVQQALDTVATREAQLGKKTTDLRRRLDSIRHECEKSRSAWQQADNAWRAAKREVHRLRLAFEQASREVEHALQRHERAFDALQDANRRVMELGMNCRRLSEQLRRYEDQLRSLEAEERRLQCEGHGQPRSTRSAGEAERGPRRGNSTKSAV